VIELSLWAAGLYPNVAWLRRFGKGETLSGLKVCAHPGSVNARAASALVVFYDIQVRLPACLTRPRPRTST
jgi:hypothetical protein